MLILVLMLTFLAGQEGPATTATRTDDLQQAREEKAQNLQKPKRTFLEQSLYEIRERRLVERFQEGFLGFHPLIGGIHPGSGFAAGASFEKSGVRASAQASLRGYQKYEVRFTAPQVFGERFFADFRATHRNYPQEQFSGIGKESSLENRTSYRLEDTNYAGRLGFSPADHMRVGAHAGWLESNIGSGTDPRFPSTETVFANGEAPGLAIQPSYVQAGAFLEADFRDQPGNPRSGGLYTASWTSFAGHNVGQYDFGQYVAEVQQYIPFFNQRRVLALRGKTTLTRSAGEDEVPFFMQPTLGGASDLRGFHEYRFRDKNMVVLNAEYRWEAFPGLDLALFADAGEVASTVADLALADLQKSYGFGFRFSTAQTVFLRVDAGFSKEGAQVFVKFNHAF